MVVGGEERDEKFLIFNGELVTTLESQNSEVFLPNHQVKKKKNQHKKKKVIRKQTKGKKK